MPEIIQKHLSLIIKTAIPILIIAFFTIIGIIKRVYEKKSSFALINSLHDHSLLYILNNYRQYGITAEDNQSLQDLTPKKKQLMMKVIQVEAAKLSDYVEGLIDNNLVYDDKPITNEDTWEEFANNMHMYLNDECSILGIPGWYIEMFDKDHINACIKEIIDEGKEFIAIPEYTEIQKYNCLLLLIQKHFSMDRVILRIKHLVDKNGEIETKL
jgi:hypothetical protein